MSALEIILGSVPNPDFGQRRGGPQDIAAHSVRVADLREARETALAFLREHDLGGGNWGPRFGKIMRASDGLHIARMSYNGRLWALDGTEVTP